MRQLILKLVRFGILNSIKHKCKHKNRIEKWQFNFHDLITILSLTNSWQKCFVEGEVADLVMTNPISLNLKKNHKKINRIEQ